MIAGGLRTLGAKRNMNLKQFWYLYKLDNIDVSVDILIVTDQCNYF